MKFQIDCNIFFNSTFELAVKETVSVSVGFISAKLINKNCYAVKYNVWVKDLKKWRVCNTFVSVKTLIQVKTQQLIERSKEVHFVTKPNETGYATTLNQHHTDGVRCDCFAYNNAINRIFINGHCVCKHTIAYAKQINGINTLSEYINWRNQINNNLAA